jgi:hypothetical protein
MQSRYEHRQFGVTTVVLMCLVLAAVFMAQQTIPDGGARRAMAAVFALVAIIGAIFSQMTVRVGDADVRWWLGFGFPGGALNLSEIVEARIVRTSLLEGWGIHLTWHGWLWNTSGFSAVQLVRGDGVPITLGTDEPEALLAAIEEARSPFDNHV